MSGVLLNGKLEIGKFTDFEFVSSKKIKLKSVNILTPFYDLVKNKSYQDLRILIVHKSEEKNNYRLIQDLGFGTVCGENSTISSYNSTFLNEAFVEFFDKRQN